MIKKIIRNIVLIGAVNLFASPSIDLGTSESEKIIKEKSLQQKKTFDNKKSDVSKESSTKTYGKDFMTQKQWKKAEQLNKSNSFDTTINIENLFLNKIFEFEKKNRGVFGSCKLYLNPKKMQDFGFNFYCAGKKESDLDKCLYSNVKGGWVREFLFDGRGGTYILKSKLAEDLETATKSNAPVDLFVYGASNRFLNYRNCMGYYGAIIGQSILTLNKNIQEITSLKEDKKNKILKVEDIGLEDLKKLAISSLQKTLKQGVNSSYIKNYYYKIINNEENCNFYGNFNNILCGNSILSITTAPGLTISGVDFFGKSFAGLNGTYKINANFSYSNSIDNLKNVSKYKKFARDIQKYSELLTSEGKGKEAIQLQRKAFEWASDNKTAVKVDKNFIK